MLPGPAVLAAPGNCWKCNFSSPPHRPPGLLSQRFWGVGASNLHPTGLQGILLLTQVCTKIPGILVGKGDRGVLPPTWLSTAVRKPARPSHSALCVIGHWELSSLNRCTNRRVGGTGWCLGLPGALYRCSSHGPSVATPGPLPLDAQRCEGVHLPYAGSTVSPTTEPGPSLMQDRCLLNEET